MAERGRFTARQVEHLLMPIRPSRVFHTNGLANLAAYDVQAHLTRCFGFAGWEKEILELACICEDRGDGDVLRLAGKGGWYITYRCQLRLRVYTAAGQLAWSNEDAATGTASNLPGLGEAHDMAAKAAVSYALKRCAIGLGDQFGLSLYNSGLAPGKPLVGRVLTDDTPTIDVEEPAVPADHNEDQ